MRSTESFGRFNSSTNPSDASRKGMSGAIRLSTFASELGSGLGSGLGSAFRMRRNSNESSRAAAEAWCVKEGVSVLSPAEFLSINSIDRTGEE